MSISPLSNSVLPTKISRLSHVKLADRTERTAKPVTSPSLTAAQKKPAFNPTRVSESQPSLAASSPVSTNTTTGAPRIPNGATALFGDLNGDNLVDADDLNSLLANWGSEDSIADIDQDGTVGQQDLDILLAYFGQDVSGLVKKEYSNLDFGDVDGNGSVDADDLNAVLSGYGTDNAKVDVNGDGRVDQNDLATVLAYWGRDVNAVVAQVNGDDSTLPVVASASQTSSYEVSQKAADNSLETQKQKTSTESLLTEALDIIL